MQRGLVEVCISRIHTYLPAGLPDALRSGQPCYLCADALRICRSDMHRHAQIQWPGHRFVPLWYTTDYRPGSRPGQGLRHDPAQSLARISVRAAQPDDGARGAHSRTGVGPKGQPCCCKAQKKHGAA